MQRRADWQGSRKTVVVTGAASGIGRATIRAFAHTGASVVAVDIDAEGAEGVAADCGGRAYQADVADRGAMGALAEALISDVGVPDVVVNNAGVGMSGRFLDTTPEDWDWILGINLRGVINGCWAFGPSMVRRGSGHVVNVASILAYAPRATEPAYCTTKAAVLALSQCLRADWHENGVGVSVVCPGLTATSIITSGRFRGERARAETVDDLERLFARGHPPDTVAAAIVDAVARNRGVVPVGGESRLGWLARRLLPSGAVDRMARTELSLRPSRPA